MFPRIGNAFSKLTISVINRLRRICQIKHHRTVRFRPTAVYKPLGKINAAVEIQTSGIININIQGFEICWSIDISFLDGIVRDHDMLLIWGDFNIVRTDGGLTFIGVVESFDVC